MTPQSAQPFSSPGLVPVDRARPRPPGNGSKRSASAITALKIVLPVLREPHPELQNTSPGAAPVPTPPATHAAP